MHVDSYKVFHTDIYFLINISSTKQKFSENLSKIKVISK